MELCINDKEIKAAYQVMKQLRNQLSESEYLKKVKMCQQAAGYKLYIQRSAAGEIIACCGVMPMPTLYYDHCLWVCDLVVDEQQRSKGIGSEVLRQLIVIAKNEGFNEIALSSGLKRTGAHHFYEQNEEFEKVGYVFKKSI